MEVEKAYQDERDALTDNIRVDVEQKEDTKVDDNNNDIVEGTLNNIQIEF